MEEGMEIQAAVADRKISSAEEVSSKNEAEYLHERERNVYRGYSRKLSRVGAVRSTSNYVTSLENSVFK